MKKTGIAACLLASALLSFHPAVVRADDAPATEQQVTDQQSEIDALEARINELEKKLDSQSGAATPAGEDEALSNQVQQIKDTVTDAEGPVQTVISDVSKLKKIKVSGYVQARFEDYQNVSGKVNVGDNKSLDNRFYLRRARFKIAGQPTSNTIGVVQLDLSGYNRDNVSTKDVYLEYHPWGVGVPSPFFVRFGQMNWPFGYIIERSSSAREVPERPKVFAGTTVGLPGYPSFNGLFPGERDKGIALISSEGSNVDWAAGLYNGTGTKSGTFLANGGKFEDNNANKTFVGRMRYPLSEKLNVGTSAWLGSQGVTVGSIAKNVSQTRWGVDFQYYMQGASFKGEYVTGKEPFYATPTANAGQNRTINGWYLVGVKNITEKDQFVVQYDTMADHASAAQIAADSTLSAYFGDLGTWNLGVVHFLDDATRLKLFYEINNEQQHQVSNNGLRFEVLTVF